jgi:hypothetical protein
MPRPAGFALIALAPNATAKPTIIAPQSQAAVPAQRGRGCHTLRSG